MKTKYKIGIFIDHDIMVRHFLHSEVFLKLFKDHDVDVVVPEVGNKRLTLDPEPWVSGSTLIRLKANKVTLSLWARLMQIEAMRFNSKAPNMRKAWRLVQSWKSEILHTILGLPGIYNAFKCYAVRRVRSQPNIELRALIKDRDYDFVLNPGIPNGIYVNDLIFECNAQDIPMVHIMNSWDNPSSGPFASGRPDAFLAWGRQTAMHAKEYQGFPDDDIYLVGAAQFEIFNSVPTVTREVFCKEHEIPIENTIILYAGGSLGTNEFEHLSLLDESIESGKVGSVTVVYRPHPWGGGGNAGEKIISHEWKHVRIENTMKGYLVSLKEKGYHLTFPSYLDTHNVLSISDTVISPLSTILIEAALHGKPIMCFLPLEDVSARHFQTVHHLPHFVDLQNDPNVVLAKGRGELIDKLPNLLAKVSDPNFEENIKRTCEFFVSSHKDQYSERIIKILKDIEEKRKLK